VDTVTLPQTGTYKIFVDDAGDIADTGPYEFVVWNVPPTTTTPIAVDQVVSDTISVPGQRIDYTLNGLAGENVYFAVQNDPGDLAFTLFAPNGSAVFSSSNHNVGPFALPLTGTYRIEVAHNTGFFDPIDATGPYQFQLFDIIPAGQPANDVADSKGTDFWLGFPGNLLQDGPFHPEPPPDDQLLISADTDTVGNVTIPGIGYYAFFAVKAGMTTTVHLPSGTDTQQGDGIDPFGVHVTSQNEVSVAAVSYLTATTDGFLALPADVLGTQYIVMAYGGGTLFSGSQLDVVATANNTTVTITPAVSTNFRPAGVPYTITLQQGQIYQLRANNPNDLTGTRISASNPVAVYGGNQACFIPASSHWANFITDQMLPVSEWGKKFETEPLATRLKGDPIRILASVNGTNVSINGTVVATLNKGQFIEEQITQPSEITADQPVLVMQYSNSTGFDGVEPADPSMMTVPSVDQYLSSYTVTTPAINFPENFVNVLVPAADVGQLTLDGTPVPAASFTPIGTGTYFGAQLSLTPGTHRLAAPQPFGAIAYGYNTDDAYSYPAGFNFAGPVVVSHVALAPKTATDLDGTQATVVATVTDSLNNPVVGFRVTFQVSGANPTTGSAVTDASGQARFSYTGTQPGSDTITATAATFSDTATVTWVNRPPTVSFSSPAPGSTLAAGTSVVLSGQALPGSPLAPIVLVTVNGKAVDASDPAGDFFASETIVQGSNVFTVVATDSLGQTASATLTLSGASGGGLPSGQSSDVTALGRLSYSGTTFNRHTQTLYAFTRLTDVATVPLAGPVQAVVSPFTPAGVALANPDGQEADGRPFINLLGGSGAHELLPGASSSPVLFGFSDPTLARFTFGVTLLGPGNTVPVFSSVPIGQAGTGVLYTYQAIVTDTDADSLAFRLTTAPAGMTVDAQGKVTWTPTAAQQGVQQVQLTADDGRGGTVTQSFSIQVSANPPNQVPVFQSVPPTHADPGALYTYTPKVSDPDADTLHFFLDSSPVGMMVDGGTGQVTFQTSGSGSFAVKLRVDDGHGGSAVQSYVLTVGQGSSDAVTITSTPPSSAVVAIPLVYLPSTQDAAGQSLTFSLLSGPGGASINATTGRIDWTPTAGQVGPQTLVLAAADALGASAVQTFTVTVQAQLPDLPPIFQSTPLRLATQGVTYIYTPQVLEPEGDPVQFTLVLGAPGMTINAGTGQITFAPTAANLGNYNITIKGTDPAGNAGFQSFVLSVRPPTVAPALTTTPVTTVTAGTVYHYLVGATDGPDAFTFSLIQGPAGMTVDPQSGLVTWQPTTADLGAHAVDIRLTNERGAVSDQTFTLTVAPDTTPPSVTVLLSTNVTQPGQAVTIQVSGTDDVAVASFGLSINGTPVTLDASHSATFTPTGPGLLSVVGTATDTSGNVGTTTVTLRVIDPTDTDFPTVAITGPVSGDTVSYLTPITGTVTDPDLEFYTLEYAAAATDQWTQFGGGTAAVVNGVLGTFDPTLLADQDYLIRLTAQDVSGKITIREVPVSVVGLAKPGNFHLSYTDLSVPLAGIPITITRTYDTTQASQAGDFGYGWQLGMLAPNIHETVPVTPGEQGNPFLAQPFRQGTKVYLTNPAGKRDGFTFTPTAVPGLLGTIWHPLFTPDPGVFDQLQVDDTTLSQRPDGTFGLYLVGFAYNPDEYRLVTPDGSVYRYNQFTGLESATDTNGNVLTVTPNGITSSTGQAIQFVRDASGRITKIIDPAGHAISYGYDAAGNLVSVTNQIGKTSTYQYLTSPAHYLSAAFDASGNRAIGATYDATGRLTGVQDGVGDPTTTTYDLMHFTEHVQDGLGNVTTLVYDARGNIVSRTDPLGNTTTFVFDQNNDEIARTDARGFTTVRTYDAHGNVLTITDPLSGVQQYTYNQLNEVLTATDQLGRVTTNVYDASGNLLKTTDPAGFSASDTYDSQGRQLTFTDKSGATTHYVYAQGPDPVQVINPDGTSELLAYNVFGEQSLVTDETGNNTTITYDDTGAPTTLTDPNGHSTSFVFDANNRLTSVTDADGNTTQYVYDAAGRITREIDPLGKVTQYFYDAAGNYIKTIDPNGQERDFQYDAAGRQTAEIWRSGGAVVRTITYKYDADGNLIFASDPDSTYTMTYDALNRLTSEDNAGTPGVPHVVLTYHYDAVGNVLSVTDNQGVSEVSTYDVRNELASLVWSGAGIAARVNFTYTALGEAARVDRFADTAGTHLVASNANQYDQMGRLKEMTYTSAASAVLADYQYSYDGAGHVTSVTDHGNTTTYTYDKLGEVLSATRTAGPGETFQWDANGNQAGPGVVIGPGNRLLTDGTFNYTYDNNGNLVAKTAIATDYVTTFTYDFRNRLTDVVQKSAGGIILSTSHYTYDVFGRRIAETANGQGLVHVYNGANVWADYTASGAVLARYLFGNQIDMTLARYRPGDGIAWYLADQFGTVRDIVNSAGTLIDHIDYSTFGSVLAETNPAAGDRFKFTGRELDTATGLYYYRARYYDPGTQRFLSQDPLGLYAGDLNPYRYAGNNSISFRDPTGLDDDLVSYAELSREDMIRIHLYRNWLRSKIINGLPNTPNFFAQYEAASDVVYGWAQVSLNFIRNVLPNLPF
jgi:RHS repeat-associated protein